MIITTCVPYSIGNFYVEVNDSAGIAFSPEGDDDIAAQYNAPACNVQMHPCEQRHFHPVHGDAQSMPVGAASAMRARLFIYTKTRADQCGVCDKAFLPNCTS